MKFEVGDVVVSQLGNKFIIKEIMYEWPDEARMNGRMDGIIALLVNSSGELETAPLDTLTKIEPVC